MGTAILVRSHDCFQGRLRHDAFSLSSPKSPQRNPNPNSGRSRRRTPASVKASGGGDRSTVVVKGPGANLVMGQVKILKRGEKLPEIVAKTEERFDLGLGSTDRLGPDPETLQKVIRVSDLKDGMYAGSAFVSSPPPSSVPVPWFLGKKNGAAATSDLRRLLRLDSVWSIWTKMMMFGFSVDDDELEMIWFDLTAWAFQRASFIFSRGLPLGASEWRRRWNLEEKK